MSSADNNPSEDHVSYLYPATQLMKPLAFETLTRDDYSEEEVASTKSLSRQGSMRSTRLNPALLTDSNPMMQFVFAAALLILVSPLEGLANTHDNIHWSRHGQAGRRTTTTLQARNNTESPYNLEDLYRGESFLK